MEFKELFREKYRKALEAARGGDEAGVKTGLIELVDIFHKQYNSNNGDAIVIKAKLKYWEDTFSMYVQIINMVLFCPIFLLLPNSIAISNYFDISPCLKAGDSL